MNELPHYVQLQRPFERPPESLQAEINFPFYHDDCYFGCIFCSSASQMKALQEQLSNAINSDISLGINKCVTYTKEEQGTSRALFLNSGDDDHIGLLYDSVSKRVNDIEDKSKGPCYCDSHIEHLRALRVEKAKIYTVIHLMFHCTNGQVRDLSGQIEKATDSTVPVDFEDSDSRNTIGEPYLFYAARCGKLGIVQHILSGSPHLLNLPIGACARICMLLVKQSAKDRRILVQPKSLEISGSQLSWLYGIGGCSQRIGQARDLLL